MLGELDRDLDVAGLVPALPSHVQLELVRHLVRPGAGIEVVTGPPRPFEGLNLADEDAVHEKPGSVGRLGVRGSESLASVVHRRVAGVEDHVLDPDTLEARVPGQIVNR